jgi:hypothetical protein
MAHVSVNNNSKSVSAIWINLTYIQAPSHGGASGHNAPTTNSQISNTNMLISPLKKVTPYCIHVLPLLNHHGWKQFILKHEHICSMFFLNVIEHIMLLQCRFCGPDISALYAYACIIYTHSVWILQHYIHTYAYACRSTCAKSCCTHCVHGLAMALLTHSAYSSKYRFKQTTVHYYLAHY